MHEDAHTSDDSILRADTLARVYTPAAKRTEVLPEFDRSGLSGARFARQRGSGRAICREPGLREVRIGAIRAC